MIMTGVTNFLQYPENSINGRVDTTEEGRRSTARSFMRLEKVPYVNARYFLWCRKDAVMLRDALCDWKKYFTLMRGTFYDVGRTSRYCKMLYTIEKSTARWCTVLFMMWEGRRDAARCFIRLCRGISLSQNVTTAKYGTARCSDK